MKLNKHYDKKNDIFAVSWGDCEFSRDFFNGDLILDFDKNENVTGFEFLSIKHHCKKSDERTRKLLWREGK